MKNIPNKPGIYLFYNINRGLIYVGKATNLKSRVSSYFNGKTSRLRPSVVAPQSDKPERPVEEMIHQVKDIKWIVTDSALEAIILEASYIKRFQPKYNVLGKDDKSWNYIVIDKGAFPHPYSMRQHDFNRLTDAQRKRILHAFGPFPGLNTMATLKLLRRLFNYSTCEPDQDKPCFYYQLNQCLGVCTGEMNSKEYKKKVLNPMVLFLKGKKKILIKQLEKLMRLESKKENFEEAGRLYGQISNLKKIHDVAILNKTFHKDSLTSHLSPPISNIEGYDISNLGPTNKVGAMVVFKNGFPSNSDYRKFRIRKVLGQSDVDCLKEMLERRLNHQEWPLPELFLIDGGVPQVNTIKSVLNGRNLNIPVVGIAKGPERKKNEFIIPKNKKLADWIDKNQTLLINVRDEAHRFAIKYQRQTRKI
ncbi:MAG: GIY-YIG nuclease family protein [Parcubacteria group bacterium]